MKGGLLTLYRGDEDFASFVGLLALNITTQGYRIADLGLSKV